MKDDRDIRVHIDENGVEHYKDSDEKVHYGMPPKYTSKK